MGKIRYLDKGPHQEFGARVAKAFNHAGLGDLSYEKKGAKIGISGGAMGKILNGHQGAKYEVLREIAIITGTNFEWLATGRGPMVYSISGGVIDISSLPADKQDIARSIVDTLKD